MILGLNFTNSLLIKRHICPFSTAPLSFLSFYFHFLCSSSSVFLRLILLLFGKEFQVYQHGFAVFNQNQNLRTRIIQFREDMKENNTGNFNCFLPSLAIRNAEYRAEWTIKSLKGVFGWGSWMSKGFQSEGSLKWMDLKVKGPWNERI